MSTNTIKICLLCLALHVCIQLGSSPAFADGHSPTCIPLATPVDETLELSQPGHYCLQSDIEWTQTGPAISIDGDDIHVNLMTHHIHGVAGTRDQIGMLVSPGVKGISIENGTIASVQVGIRAQEVDQLQIADMNISNVAWIGVQISGMANTVVRSHFEDIGYMDDGENDDGYAIGILAGGEQMRIVGNSFHNVTRQPVPSGWTSEGVSILLSENSNEFVIQRNKFTNSVKNIAHAIGIWARTSRATIIENQFTDLESPVLGAYLGETELSNNEFKIAALGARALEKVDDRARFIAVAMNMDESSFGRFGHNTFTGYVCPIQFSGTPKVQTLLIEDNTIAWPAGHRFCKDVGVWYSPEAFGPLQFDRARPGGMPH